MDTQVALLSALLIIFGWVLNELHQFLAAYSTHRGALRRALACLLEVRFQVKALELVVSELKHRMPQASSLMPQFRSILEAVVCDNTIETRYQQALEVVAARDPILAYKLTSKNKAVSYFRVWRNWAGQVGAPAAELENVETKMKQFISPELDTVILSVAKKVSLLAWWKVRRIVGRQVELPPELSELLEQITATANNEFDQN